MTLSDQILTACPASFFDICAKVKASQGEIADEIERQVTAKSLLVEMNGTSAVYSATPVQAELFSHNEANRP